MQELVWSGRADWREAVAPRLTGGLDALVRPVIVVSCDLDVLTVRGHAPLGGAFRVGHEGVAEVLSVGEAVRGFAPGDLVIVPFQISCGACPTCRRGRTDSCDTVPPLSMYGLGPLAGFDGGGFLADVVHVPYADAMLVAVPPGIDPAEVASCGDNAADGWRAVGPFADEALAQDGEGRSVAVLGAGAIGLYAAGVGAALGLNVDYFDTSASRLLVASALGARPVQAQAPPPGRTYAITVSARPSASALRAAIAATRPGGACTDVAIHFEGEVSLPLYDMYTQGVRFGTGRVAARAVLPRVLELVTAHRFTPGVVTAQRVAWEDAAAAWPEMRAKTLFWREPVGTR